MIEHSEFLGDSFFKDQGQVNPQLIVLVEPYKLAVRQYIEIASIKTGEFDLIGQAVADSFQAITARQNELTVRQNSLAPNPQLDLAKGGWKRSFGRVRVHLSQALARNTVPWPFMWIARRLARPEDPSITPFRQAVNEAKGVFEERTADTLKQRDEIIQRYRPTLVSWRELIDKEEGQVLSDHEATISEGGDTDHILSYFSKLPPEKREGRKFPAAHLFTEVNELILAQKKESLDEYYSFIDENIGRNMDSKSVRLAKRLKDFVESMKKEIQQSKDSGKPLRKQQYTAQDQYIIRRWKAFIGYSLLDKLYRQGLISIPPEIPQIFQY